MKMHFYKKKTKQVVLKPGSLEFALFVFPQLFFTFKTIIYLCFQKTFYSWKVANKLRWVDRKIQNETRAMWVVGTVRVSHCDHNSLSGTADYMGVIHTKSSKACCSVSFFFFFSPPFWLWPGLAFERCTRICHFRQGILWCCFLLCFTVTNQTFQSNGLEGRMFTAGSKSNADKTPYISKSFVSQTFLVRQKVACCNSPTLEVHFNLYCLIFHVQRFPFEPHIKSLRWIFLRGFLITNIIS